MRSDEAASSGGFDLEDGVEEGRPDIERRHGDEWREGEKVFLILSVLSSHVMKKVMNCLLKWACHSLSN